MNLKLNYLVFGAAVLLGVLSCSEGRLDPNSGEPAIEFSVSLADEKAVPTKSVLDPDSALGEGAEFYLYDQTYNPGTTTGKSGHINGVVLTYDSPVWTTTGTFKWNKQDHYFFGWLKAAKGTDNSTLIGTPALDGTTNTISIGSSASPIEVTLNSNQTDFCYSKMVYRSQSTPDYSVVDIPLQHLFACFGFKAHNYTNEDIVIRSVKLYGLKNRKYATVLFDIANKCSTPTYTAATTGSTWTETAPLELLKNTSGTVSSTDYITIAADDGSVDNIITCSEGGSKATTAKDAFYLMWPQTLTEIKNSYIAVTYTSGTSTTPITRTVSLWPTGSEVGWDGGTRHAIELAFEQKYLTLKIQAMPWEYVEPTIDYSAVLQVPSSGMVKPNETKSYVDGTTKYVYLRDGLPAEFSFQINSPIDGTWLVTKNGDFDAFEIDNATLDSSGDPISDYGDGVDYNYGTIDGNTAKITIYPKITDPKRDYKITLSFSVRTSSGRVINADKELQGDPETTIYYTIILQAS